MKTFFIAGFMTVLIAMTALNLPIPLLSFDYDAIVVYPLDNDAIVNTNYSAIPASNLVLLTD